MLVFSYQQRQSAGNAKKEDANRGGAHGLVLEICWTAIARHRDTRVDCCYVSGNLEIRESKTAPAATEMGSDGAGDSRSLHCEIFFQQNQPVTVTVTSRWLLSHIVSWRNIVRICGWLTGKAILHIICF